MSSNIYSHLNLNPKDITEFSRRRLRVQRKLKKDEVLISFSGSHKQKSRDTEYPFKQNTNFYYLTGLQKSEGFLYLTQNKEIFFLKERPLFWQKWLGKTPSVKDLNKIELFTETKSDSEFNEKLFSGFKSVIFPWFEEKSKSMKLWTQITETMRRDFPRTTTDLDEFITEFRMLKSPWEMRKIKKSCSIAVKAHQSLREFCSTASNEKDLTDFLTFKFMSLGATGLSYDAIMAGGNNANILHYIDNNKPLKSTELLLVDAGCEYDGYASDITRTYPISSEWSEPQKIIADIVAQAQKESIKMIRPGASWQTIEKKSRKIMAQGLRSEKILKGSLESILKSEQFRELYPHSLGHSIGLDVHDLSPSYKELKLSKGNVVTIEPGLYIDKNNRHVPKQFRGIGVRLEDDIFVTSSGRENLTESLDLL